jgi:hypothetical protein
MKDFNYPIMLKTSKKTFNLHIISTSANFPGLMEQDTFKRDNIVNHRGVNYGAKAQLQAVPKRV